MKKEHSQRESQLQVEIETLKLKKSELFDENTVQQKKRVEMEEENREFKIQIENLKSQSEVSLTKSRD